jgi:hypothetical protein
VQLALVSWIRPVYPRYKMPRPLWECAVSGGCAHRSYRLMAHPAVLALDAAGPIRSAQLPFFDHCSCPLFVNRPPGSDRCSVCPGALGPEGKGGAAGPNRTADSAACVSPFDSSVRHTPADAAAMGALIFIFSH